MLHAKVPWRQGLGTACLLMMGPRSTIGCLLVERLQRGHSGSLTAESCLDLGLLCIPESLDILPPAVVSSTDLVEGVVGMFLKLLPDLVNLLLSSQALLVLHLLESSLLKGCVGGLETSLGMLVYLVLGSCGQGQSVQSVVDTSGAE